ncbi:MAG: MmcQ/YjbR family DNA-binding protein [Saprospiraceae bacterium]
MNTQEFINDVLSFPEVVSLAHFEKISFRTKKKIFATLDKKNNLVCVKLSEIDQNIFHAMNAKAIYPVPNKWGKSGWTYVDISNLERKVVYRVVRTAYNLIQTKN